MEEFANFNLVLRPSNAAARPANRQSGLAIITVLLIISLMVTLLALLVEKQHLVTRRIANQAVSDQGFHYAMGVEAWASRVLHDDPDRAVDSWVDDWALFGDPPKTDSQNAEGFSLNTSSQEDREPLPEVDFGIDGLAYKIEDLQSRYNLNNLATNNTAQRAQQKQVFLNLLEILEIGDIDTRQQLVAALIDWLDKNDLATANGVESATYQSKQTSYYAADQMLSTLGELRFIEGFSKEVINTLSPYVAVLPTDLAAININTTSTEVMSALGSPPVIDTSSAQAFLAQRLDPNFYGFQPNQIQAAESAIIGNSLTGGGFVKNMMQTSTQYFMITTRIELGDYRYCSYSTVFRGSSNPDSDNAAKIIVLSRQHDTTCDEIIR